MDLVSLIAEPTDDGIIEDLLKTNIREGEKRLMLALLENAIEDFQKYALANDKARKNCSKKPKIGFLLQAMTRYFRSRISVNIYS